MPIRKAPSTAPGALPSPPSTAAANSDKQDARAGQRIDRAVEPQQHAADADQAHADEARQGGDALGPDALQRRQLGIVGRGAHGLADAGEGERREHQQHQQQRQAHGLELLRADADLADEDVARDRPVVAARLVAEAQPHDVLQDQPGGDRGDGRRQGALLDQRQVRHLVEGKTGDARHGEGDGKRARHLQAGAIGEVAREGAERRHARHREVGEAQHGEHRREADGGHGEKRARHDAVNEGLEDDHGLRSAATPGRRVMIMSGP